MPNLTRRAVIALGALFPATLRAASHAKTEVVIQNFAFSPKSVSVKAGAAVRFVNKDSAPHTATADDGSFNTGTLQPGQSAEVTIPKGSHSYFCKFHRNMKGSATGT